MDRRKNHFVKERKKNLRHLLNRLVPQATEDQRPRPLVLQRAPQSRAQSPRAGGIVRHIQNPFHAVSLNALQPARPTRLPNSLRNDRRRNAKPMFRSPTPPPRQSPAPGCCADARPSEANRPQSPLPAPQPVSAQRLPQSRHIRRRAHSAHIQLGRHLAQHLVRLGMLRQSNHRPARAAESPPFPARSRRSSTPATPCDRARCR